MSSGNRNELLAILVATKTAVLLFMVRVEDIPPCGFSSAKSFGTQARIRARWEWWLRSAA
ncbi:MULTISPECIES: hypothetical protein [unclassified Streptomyces]|uniref:hypothetical protein n=1 Tax=unclassified Streptomyces TaxID=2593676 RepID=UPI0035E11BD3